MSDGLQEWDVETAYDGKTVADLESADSASNQRASAQRSAISQSNWPRRLDTMHGMSASLHPR
jgi:hypothetical protein